MRRRSTGSALVRWCPAARSGPLLCRIEDVDLPEERCGTAVRDRRDLLGLTFAAIEGATEHVRGGPAHGFHRIPEVGRTRLIRDVLHLPHDLAAAYAEEFLARELKVVPLHVDRPALVADDVEPFVQGADQIAQRDRLRACAE